jgi:hypothetical protein
VDRARAIAREYRDALHEVDPVKCAVLDRAAEEFGERWITQAAQHTDAPLVTLAELADMLGEQYKTVWQWWNRGRIPREHNGLFRPDHVVNALAAWRLERAAKADDPVTLHPVQPTDDETAGDAGGVIEG